MEARFLEMLLAGASREELDAVVDGSDDADLRRQHATALRIHEQMARLRSREAELTALYETARDLSGIRDVDAILTAIVRRARQLLHADMTYLSLNDVERGRVVHEGHRRRADARSSARCGCRWAPGCSGWWRSRASRTSPTTTRTTSGSCTATTSTTPWPASTSARSSASRSWSRAP